MISELISSSPAWEIFLKENDHLIIHRPEWKEFMAKTFPNVKSCYLAVKDGENIKSIFPFFFQESNFIVDRLIKNNRQEVIISSPYYEYGGPAGEVIPEDKYPEIISTLQTKFGSARFLEVREGVLNTYPLPFLKRTFLKRFVISLGPVEEVWRNVQKSKRKAIKKSLKEVVVEDVPVAKIDELYQLYLKNMKRFGSLPYPKSYFVNFYQSIVDCGLGRVVGAFYQGKLIAVLTGVIAAKRIHILINISDDRFLSLRPNDAIHWNFIKWGCEHDCLIFDFGRTAEDRGHFAYKLKWGGDLKDLSYHYYPLTEKIAEFNDSNTDSNNKRNSFHSILKITPLFVLKKVGPWFRQYLP